VTVLANVTVLLGILAYDEWLGGMSILAIIHIVVFFAIIFSMELIYRLVNRREVHFDEPSQTYSAH
jgi:hypothetical protein